MAYSSDIQPVQVPPYEGATGLVVAGRFDWVEMPHLQSIRETPSRYVCTVSMLDMYSLPNVRPLPNATPGSFFCDYEPGEVLEQIDEEIVDLNTNSVAAVGHSFGAQFLLRYAAYDSARAERLRCLVVIQPTNFYSGSDTFDPERIRGHFITPKPMRELYKDKHKGIQTREVPNRFEGPEAHSNSRNFDNCNEVVIETRREVLTDPESQVRTLHIPKSVFYGHRGRPDRDDLLGTLATDSLTENQTLRLVKTPTLFILANQDKTVPIDAGVRIFEQIGSEHKRLAIVDGTDHDYRAFPEKVMEIGDLINSFVAEFGCAA